MAEIVRVKINSPREMWLLGKAFAADFPYADNRITLSWYAPKGTGKTRFSDGAFCDCDADMSPPVLDGGVQIIRAQKGMEEFRLCDFGGVTHPTNAPDGFDGFTSNTLTSFGLTRAVAGLDISEHPPSFELLASDVVGIASSFRRGSSGYFAHFAEKIRPHAIGHAAFSAVVEEMGNFVRPDLEYDDPHNAFPRQVVFLLVTENESVRQAFNQFKGRVESGAWLGNG